jgi:hypothetical protein
MHMRIGSMMKKAKKENALDAVKIFLANTLVSVSALIAKALTIIRSASTVIQNMVFRK